MKITANDICFTLAFILLFVGIYVLSGQQEIKMTIVFYECPKCGRINMVNTGSDLLFEGDDLGICECGYRTRVRFELKYIESEDKDKNEI